MHIHVNTASEHLRDFAERLPELFDREGEVLHAGRNTIKAFEAGNDSSTDAVVNYETWLRGVIRFDVGILRPSWFYTATGVTAAGA